MLTLDGIEKPSVEYLPLQPVNLNESRDVNLTLTRLVRKIRVAITAAHEHVTARKFDLWLEAARKAVDAVEMLAREEHEMARSEELLTREEVEQKMKRIKSEWEGYAGFPIYLKAYQAQHKNVPIDVMLACMESPLPYRASALSVAIQSRDVPTPRQRERHNDIPLSSRPSSSNISARAKHASTDSIYRPHPPLKRRRLLGEPSTMGRKSM